MKKLFIAGFLLITVLAGWIYHSSSENALADSVLRLHVIANSDNIKDQQLKIQVKNQVVEMMKTQFSGQNDINQVRKLAAANIPVIEEEARKVINDAGFEYPVKVEMGEYLFPTKSYGNMVFPQGEYQAVKIVIGEGKGQNWWCVLFPPLCMVSDSDEGLSFDSAEEARISLKCLELLPQGVKMKLSNTE